jgi:ATP-dependent DNA helicase DinG
MGSLPPPNTCGAPAQFDSWREEQEDAVTRVSDSLVRFSLIDAPTGIGKSLIAFMIHKMLGWRTLILTSTRGLQDQYMRDFDDSGLVDIRGQSNYYCPALDGELAHLHESGLKSVDRGPCKAGVPCSIKSSGCPYFALSLPRAQRAGVVISNYSYWLSNPADILGRFDCLVLDEGHSAFDELAGAMATRMNYEDWTLLNTEGPAGEDCDHWREWSKHQHKMVTSRIDTLSALIRLGASDSMMRELQLLRQTQAKLAVVASMSSENWVAERWKSSISFNCVWPGEYAEARLFRDIPHVIPMSATILPKSIELLGVKKGEYEFFDYDSSFPLRRRPVIHLPSVQMNWRTSPEGIAQWLEVIDRAIDHRRDRKGIIHSVSYKRRNLIMANSRNEDLMVSHESSNAMEVVERFKRDRSPQILVSPSVATGYDFPYSECEYQVIGKIPFPDSRSKVMEARRKSDPDYLPFIAAQEMVQARGRGMRAPDDQCETFIVDDSWYWFRNRYMGFLPKWWRMATRSAQKGMFPEPPQAMLRELMEGGEQG